MERFFDGRKKEKMTHYSEDFFFQGKTRKYTPKDVMKLTRVSLATAMKRVSLARRGKITEAKMLKPIQDEFKRDTPIDQMTLDRIKLFKEIEKTGLKSKDKHDFYFPPLV